jgi:cold shock CspA family protein
MLLCESPIHKGKREVWTTFHPRKGQKFFCDACRNEFITQKLDAQREFVNSHLEGLGLSGAAEVAGAESPQLGVQLTGIVKKKIADRGFGFIEGAEGMNYFFHLTDLRNALSFTDVQEGMQVDFEMKKQPSLDKAGAAQNVRRHAVRAETQEAAVTPTIEKGEPSHD